MSRSMQAAAVWPLAIRSLRRHRVRYVLMACLLGLAITTYLLYTTFLAGASAQASLALAPYDLPADAVYLGRATLSTAELTRWADYGSVQAMSPARLTTYHSDRGSLRVLALPPDSPIWAAVGRGGGVGVGGSVGTAGLLQEPLPGPGQILLPPTGYAGAGETLTLIPPRAPAGRSTVEVMGFHSAGDQLLASMALALLDSSGLMPNSMFLWTRTPSGAASVASALELEYLQPGRPLLRRADDPVVLWSGTAEVTARGVLAQTYLPGAGALTMVFVFCGIGLFTISSLSFLDRKRDLAILKTIGMESGGVTAMFLIEQGIVALAGTVLAVVLALLAIPWLGAFLPTQARLSPGSVFWGAFAGILIQALGVALPTLTARVATVNQLLFNLPIPLERRRVYAGKE